VAVADYVHIFDDGQKQVARIFVSDDADTVLTTYRVDTGSFPSTEQGLAALVAAPENVAHWNGPYLKSAATPLDPWQHAYHYAYPGTHNPKGYDIWSIGPDGVNGTADDIGNW
jgi:general secretion pathway protein G